jgi:hypothetical protein
MRSSHAVAALALALTVAAGAFAQGPPPPSKVLSILREEIKAGRQAAHERTEAAWPRTFARHKYPTMYIAYTSLSGPPVVDFVTGYPSFEAWQQDMDATAKNTALSTELAALGAPDSEHLSGMRQWVAVYNEELSYQPTIDWPKVRYVRVTAFRLRPGHTEGFAEVARLYAAAHQKGGLHGQWVTYTVTDGEKTPTYFVVSPMRSLAEIDRGMADDAKVYETMGAEAVQRVTRFTKEAVLEVETTLLTPSPKMSYVTKEFAAGDPAFWTPKPTTARVAVREPAKAPGSP